MKATLIGLCILGWLDVQVGLAIPLALEAASQGQVPSGILLDLQPDLAGAMLHDGLHEAPPLAPARLRQLLFQVNQATVDGKVRLSPSRLREVAQEARGQARIPLALLDLDVQGVKEQARESGQVRVAEGQMRILDPAALETRRVFAAAALVDHTGRGRSLTFCLPDGELWIHNRTVPLEWLELNFDDGGGFTRHQPGDEVAVSYTEPGTKCLTLRARWSDGDLRETRLAFTVDRLETPQPDAIWNLTAAHAYQGASATGSAYILLAPGHNSLTHPVVLCEGFDMDNSMFWDELYGLGNQQGLVDSLRQMGFDMVVLNFTESTDYIQRNGLLLVTLLEQVNSLLPADERYALIGASMGGLVSRYALAWMEHQGLDHRVRTFISFDSPQAGANIPLGVQHWLAFFASEAEEAAYFRSRLQTPASRQMLLALAQDPPAASPVADPLRQVLLDELAALGSYPQSPRRVAVANGSGTGVDQGFAAGAQIIRYEYRNWLVDIDGNCWSLADHSPQLIFRGMINQIWPFPDRYQNVNITGTAPWDNAPGGFRNTLVQLDQSVVPYGDILALFPNHCFIPTTSALGLATDAPFRQIHGAQDLQELSPFHALYYPLGANEDHVSISPGSLVSFLQEIVPELEAPQLGIQVVEEGLRLHWNAVPMARGYQIQRSTDPTAWPAPIVTTAGLEWLFPESEERVFYRVTASLDAAPMP